MVNSAWHGEQEVPRGGYSQGEPLGMLSSSSGKGWPCVSRRGENKCKNMEWKGMLDSWGRAGPAQTSPEGVSSEGGRAVTAETQAEGLTLWICELGGVLGVLSQGSEMPQSMF